VIRFRGSISVTVANGEIRTAAAWVRPNGRARTLRGAKVTAEQYEVGTVVCVQEKDMKQAWCLAVSSPHATAKELIRYYGNRQGRMRVPRHQGPALRHGNGFGACELARAP
jgi:hypothetical protein